MAENVIIAYYQRYRGCCDTAPVTQYDYGQVLKFEDFPELPEYFEVHFANDPKSGRATTMIAHNGEVVVPDNLFTRGLDAFAWIFIHEGEGNGQTVFTVRIPVIRRSGITPVTPTPAQQDAIDQAIEALNTAVKRAEAAAQAAEQYGGDAIIYNQLINGEVVFDEGDASDWIAQEPVEPEEEDDNG